MLALEEDRVERLRVEVGVERLAVGADLAVHRPGVDEVGLARTSASPGSMWWSLVATTTSYAGALGSCRVQWCSSSAMSLATRAPPVTAQRAALAEVVLHVDDDQRLLHGREATHRRAGLSAARRGSVALVDGLDHRVALGELAGDQGELGPRAQVPLAGGLQRLAADHLAVARPAAPAASGRRRRSPPAGRCRSPRPAAVPSGESRRRAYLRPPTEILSLLFLATPTSSPSASSRATSL